MGLSMLQYDSHDQPNFVANWARPGGKEIASCFFVSLLTRLRPNTPLSLGDFLSAQLRMSWGSSKYHERGSSDGNYGN